MLQWLAGINNSALYRENIAHNRGLQFTVQWITVPCTGVKVKCFPLYSALPSPVQYGAVYLPVQDITMQLTVDNSAVHIG